MKSASVLKWISRVIGKNKIWIVMLTLVQMLQGALGVGFALALRKVVDSAVAKDLQNMTNDIVVLCIVVFVLISLITLHKYLDEKTRAILEKTFRCSSFAQLLHRSYANVADSHSGEWMNRLTSDTAVIINASIQIIPGLSGTAVRLGGALIMLLSLVPQLVAIILPAGLVLALFSLAFRNKLKVFHHKIQSADGNVRSFMQERINSLIVVKSFTQEEQTAKQAELYSNELVKARMRRIHFANICTTAMHLAMRGAYLLGVIICAKNIANDAMSYGTMIAVLQLINQVESPFAQISSYLPQYYAMIASAERLMEIENIAKDYDCEIIDKKEIEEYYKNDFLAVGLHDASFSYVEMGNGKTHVLNKKSVEIKKGEYVAFVGESGCGKSTAMKLMMSLYPLNSGEKYLLNKDNSRQELSAGWRGLFSYVPQGNYLVSGTIRQVLSFGDKKLIGDEEKIYSALKIACAEEFVRELPDGLDTILGEQGSGLSEGQIQRLAIARAILSGRPILMLDEATSSLDSETEEKLLVNLRTMTDKTVILITHRPAALSICDKTIQF